MADRPILFSAPMVRALLDGRKTQTRRVIKPEPLGNFGGIERDGSWLFTKGCAYGKIKPSFAVGDRLWVRESWWIATRYSCGSTPGGCEIPPPPLAHRKGNPVHYSADGNPPNCANRVYGEDGLRGGAFAAPDPYAIWIKKPSIHMPRWASRLTLIVADVRVERLQDISGEDAVAEGVRSRLPDNGVAQQDFADLWSAINGAASWHANPWVVAVSFDVRRSNIDEVQP